MLKCRPFQRQIAELYRGEGGFDPAIGSSLERHLGDCPACLARFRETKEMLMLTERRFKPDPSRKYWDGYWDRLEARMAAETAGEKASDRAEIQPVHIANIRSVRRRLGVPRWIAFPVAAAALLIAGILIGRYGPHSISPTPGNSPIIQASNLDVRTNQYLDRSKRILLAIVNYRPENQDSFGLDLPGRKKASRSLVQDAAVLKSDLGKAKERKLEKLVGDLQMILMQIANLKDESGPNAVHIVRAGVEDRDLIFQINLAEMHGPASERRASTSSSSSGRDLDRTTKKGVLS